MGDFCRKDFENMGDFGLKDFEVILLFRIFVSKSQRYQAEIMRIFKRKLYDQLLEWKIVFPIFATIILMRTI